MSNNDVIYQHILSLFDAEPQSFNDIQSQLGPIAERTLRRRISELVEKGLLQKSGAKRATKYTLPKLYIQKPLAERKPTSYNFDCLNDYIPNQTFYLPRSVREECHQHGQRAKESAIAGTYARQIYQRLLIDLSYNSARLEGNTYSLLETEKLLLEGLAAENRLDEEKVMILNHKDAISHLVENASRLTIDSNEILRVHYLLSDALVPTEYAGQVRNQGVRIGGSTYIPIEDEQRLIQQLESLTNKAIKIEDPFEQSLFLLAHIAYLQPFIDVNKRTSRLCANIPMIQQNLVPLSFNDVNKKEYMNAMIAMYEINDIKPLVALYRQSYLRACEQYDATLIAMAIDETRVRYRTFRRQCLQQIILNKLTGENLSTFITTQLKQHIPQNEQNAVEDDLLEDIRLLSPSRIAGLAVSQAELEHWQKLY